MTIHYGDVTDSHFVEAVIKQVCPDEIYNLAAQTHVQHSFQMPGHTIDVNLKGLLNICQAIIQLKVIEHTRIFHASTSEMFGQAGVSDVAMDVTFPFNPVSPYAVSKVASFYLVRYYRTVYKLRISTAISFNHESPLRHESFITRKITKAAARIKCGLQKRLKIGNLNAKRDWGHAGEFVKAFWLIINQDIIKKEDVLADYVVATESCITVREFLLRAFSKAGFSDLRFEGAGLEERLLSGS